MPKPITLTVIGELTRCPVCGSTDRKGYNNTRTVRARGLDAEDANGNRVTHITYRRTRCAHCGQRRRDKFRENRKAA